MSSGPNRRLRNEERELWKGVTRSVTPLRPQTDVESEPPAAVPATRKTSARSKPVPAAAAAKAKAKPKPKPAPQPPALSPLGRRMKQRLARGTEEIDGRLDLHGRTQAQAHAALLNFLHAAQSRGAKNVLIITGKGARETMSERGVLKRQVPLWLRLPEFRSLIVGFEQAHVGHGGEGALYVRMRKLRE